VATTSKAGGSASALSSTAPAVPSTPSSSSASGSTATTPSSAPQHAPDKPAAPAKPADLPRPKSYDVFHADLRYGPDDKAPVVRDVVRLSPFPSAVDPVVVFLGLESSSHDAIFAVRSDSRPTGDAACRPLAGLCLWLAVAPGKHVDLQVPAGAAGTKTHERLTVVRVSRDSTSDRAAAQAAFDRVSAAGRCVLGVQSAYRYDSTTGLLSEYPEMANCQYVAPQGKASAASVQPPGYLG
jgi:hypothetical protein